VIPLVDLSRQHDEIAEEVSAGWAEVTSSGSYILGPQVEQFEREFALFCRAEHCIGVGNGTDALELALRALGIGRGDKVVVPANSFIASALAVLRAGAELVLVDCDPTTFLIDVEQVAESLDGSVKAIMPVHLYGQMAPLEEIEEVAGHLPVLEDAAQSQGAEQRGRRAGSVGKLAGTSFYPGKNIGAYGDAGAVLTNDADLASKVRALRNWGSTEKYHHPVVGFNSRLDSLQAVVLLAKLRRLERWNAERRLAANRYNSMLNVNPAVGLPAVADGNEHVWHLYVVRVRDRDQILEKMQADGIGVGVHYPVPMHLQGALSSLPYEPGSFPVTETLATEILSLPLFPGITADEQERVVSSLLDAMSER
jgi:dTDP-4-amino-4,6-dideoxygalactose transaminase